MIRNLVCVSCIAWALVANSVAQQIEFRGEVKSAATAATCYYCPAASSFTLDCTLVHLTSTTVSLAFFEATADRVFGTGVFNGSASNPTINVTSMQVAPIKFSLGGNAGIGTHLHFQVSDVPGSLAVIAGCLTPAVQAFPGTGMLFLDLPSLVLLGSETLDATGAFEVSVQIPNDPSLNNLLVFGQALIVPTSGSSFLTEVDCRRVHL